MGTLSVESGDQRHVFWPLSTVEEGIPSPDTVTREVPAALAELLLWDDAECTELRAFYLISLITFLINRQAPDHLVEVWAILRLLFMLGYTKPDVWREAPAILHISAPTFRKRISRLHTWLRPHLVDFFPDGNIGAKGYANPCAYHSCG